MYDQFRYDVWTHTLVFRITISSITNVHKFLLLQRSINNVSDLGLKISYQAYLQIIPCKIKPSCVWSQVKYIVPQLKDRNISYENRNNLSLRIACITLRSDTLKGSIACKNSSAYLMEVTCNQFSSVIVYLWHTYFEFLRHNLYD